MIYTQKRILYTCSIDSGLGDTINNIYTWVGQLRYAHPRSVVSALLHPRTVTNVHDIITQSGIVDHVYAIDTAEGKLSTTPKYMLDVLQRGRYDMLMFSTWDTPHTFEYLVNAFPAAQVLKSRESPFACEAIEDYVARTMNVDAHHYRLRLVRDYFEKDYHRLFVEDCRRIVSDAGYSKAVCLFGVSSRPLAHVGPVGVKAIVELCNSHGLFCFICGTSVSNCYNGTVDWDSVNAQSFGAGSCNVAGMPWLKLINLMRSTQATIVGPTGACMIPPIFGIPLIWLSGGDSPIMGGCLRAYTHLKHVTEIPCNCEFFPCDLNIPGRKDSDVRRNCVASVPACLNADLNLASLREALKRL